MINNVTVAVNASCNSRCLMCNQWKGAHTEEMTVSDFKILFDRPEFRGVEYLNITGGEPFLRRDIAEIIEAVSARMAGMRTFFVSTNGTMPDRTHACIETLAKNFISWLVIMKNHPSVN